MEAATPTFRRSMDLEGPDLARFGLLEHPIVLDLEDNGPQSFRTGAPIALILEVHPAGQDPTTVVASLTIPELYQLQDNINAAIVFAESLS